jgi:hypothetical protein
MIGRGNRSTRKITCPSAALSTTNPTCYPDANPGRRGGKPPTNPLSYGTNNTAIHLVNNVFSDTQCYNTCPNARLLHSTLLSACQLVLIIYLHRRDLRTRRSEKAFALIMVSYKTHLSPYNLTCGCSSRKVFACCIATNKNNRVGSMLEILPKLFCVKTSRCM